MFSNRESKNKKVLEIKKNNRFCGFGAILLKRLSAAFGRKRGKGGKTEALLFNGFSRSFLSRQVDG